MHRWLRIESIPYRKRRYFFIAESEYSSWNEWNNVNHSLYSTMNIPNIIIESITFAITAILGQPCASTIRLFTIYPLIIKQLVLANHERPITAHNTLELNVMSLVMMRAKLETLLDIYW
jgi:hypothetical protein